MISIIILTGAALILSIMLVVVNTLINKEDKRVSEIEKMLPGLNCGGCGYPGCSGMADALAEGTADVEKCKPSKPEAREQIKQYLVDHPAE